MITRSSRRVDISKTSEGSSNEPKVETESSRKKKGQRTAKASGSKLKQPRQQIPSSLSQPLLSAHPPAQCTTALPPTLEQVSDEPKEQARSLMAGKRPRSQSLKDCSKRRKLSNFVKIDFRSSEPDPVVEHLKEHVKKNTGFKTSRIDITLIDQIALEGLSGITLGRLFRILEVIYPSLPCTKNEDCQSFIWSLIVTRYLRYPPDAGIRVYHLNKDTQEKTNEVHRSPSKGVIIDKQIKLPTQTVKRIAKSDSLLSPVQDGTIMGSCANYLDRVDITNELLEITSSEVTINSMYVFHEKYDLNNIYFVASQALRAKAILPNWADPNVDIKLREYCALELIGKSRTLGTVFPNDKALGRYRIMLEAKGFITQFQESMSLPIEHHLKRFSNVRHQTLSADSSTKSKSKSKSLRNINEGGKNEYEDDEDEDLSNGADNDIDGDDDDDEVDNDKAPLTTLCCNPSKLKANRSILTMVYDVIAESGGITQMDIRRELHLPKFHVRNHLKNLISLEMIRSRSPKEVDSVFRIFTAHKSRKKRKARGDLAKPIGIMASWDEADLRAKKIIGHKRSSFSQAEDSLLILCRIASVLIEPKLKLSWCVNKRLVRDLLHKELVEAHDKTSDACLRRIKYLKRLPNNIMSINELMAELQDDIDIRKLLKSDRFKGKTNRRFIRVLKCVRTKIPNLLGISSSPSLDDLSCSNRWRNRSFIAGKGSGISSKDGISEAAEINDHKELKQKYELLDCQSVASIQRAPTYDAPKNVVDVKFNNASLVTMAFTLSGCLGSSSSVGDNGNSSSSSSSHDKDTRSKRINQWLLDKFYSNYHDKLISSVLSKLNKRSLLTRKCSVDQASLYKPRSKMSLKLNQSVLFLLNRYHSHSLIQLAHPISSSYKIELSESNEMASIALLTSLCALSSFNLDMKLRIPANVVGIDQGNENFKSLCEKANDSTREILARFMSRCGESFTTINSSKHAKSAKTTSSDSSSDSSLLVNSKEDGSQDKTLDKLSSAQCEREASASGPLNANPFEATTSATTNSSSAIPTTTNKMDDSRRALFLLRHELRAHALDKCGSLADCLIVQPCNVKFYSDRLVEHKGELMEDFLDKSKPVHTTEHLAPSHASTDQSSSSCSDRQRSPTRAQQSSTSNWWVKSYRFEANVERGDDLITSERGDILLEASKKPVEYEARLWKQIDGTVDLTSLFKLIESLLSWTIVFPGVELSTLQREFSHLMPEEHLFELLEFMEKLELVSSEQLEPPNSIPRLFGSFHSTSSSSEVKPSYKVYETTPNAYVRYCQLLNYCKCQD